MVKGNRQAPRSYTPERCAGDAARGDRVRRATGPVRFRGYGREKRRARRRASRAPTDASRARERSRAVRRRATRARRDARARYRRARVDGSRARASTARRARGAAASASARPVTRKRARRRRECVWGGRARIRAHTYLRRTLSDHEGVELRESVAPCTSRTRIRVVRRLTGRTGRQFIPG